MIENIFKSRITLAFSNPIIEKTFLQKQINDIKRYTLVFTLLNFGVSLASSIVVIIPVRDISDEQMEKCYRVYLPTSLFISCLYLIFSILTIFIHNSKFQKIINYCNYCFICLSFVIMRGAVKVLWKSDMAFFFLIQFIEFFCKMIWTLSCTLGFVETLILSITNLALTTIAMTAATPWWKTHAFATILTLMIFFAIIITTYFYVKELRRSFYFDSEIKIKNQWYENILDNMNTGFMCINASNNQILFLNKSVLEHIIANPKVMPLIQVGNGMNEIQLTSLSISEDQVNYDAMLSKIKQNSHEILKNLFANFVINKELLHQENTQKNLNFPIRTERVNLNENKNIKAEDTSSLEMWFKNIKEICDKYQANKKFVYVGRGSFNSRRESIINNSNSQYSSVFEIYCRYYKQYGSEADNYDLIFNDVTRTRIIEAKNAGSRYKSLYLEKIAHEFKNPIIAISELVEQVGNLQSESKPESRNQSFAQESILLHTLSSGCLTMIKSLADYLLILIKNLYYFSKVLNTEDQSSLTIVECNIDELLKFNQRIAKALLRANDKDKDIKLFITKDINIPVNINTDEIMLKQIFISLLTNAIKFTNKGQIVLHAANEGEFIKFSVTDTGIGISPIQEDYLFKHIEKTEEEWLQTGGEFGLTLVKDMTSKLGKNLEYSTEIGKGTSFWFYVKSLPLSNDNRTTSSTKLHKWLSKDNHICPININISSSKSNDSQVSIETKKIDNSIMLFPKKFREKKTVVLWQEELSTFGPIEIEKEILPSDDKETAPLNFLIADDEAFTRQATIRIFKTIAQNKKVNINIIEAQDGIETIYLAYKYLIKGEGLKCIISDENMPFWSGRKSAEILNELGNRKNIAHVPFFLVSAYEECMEKSNVNIDGFFTKPLMKSGADYILSKVIEKTG